MEHFENGFSLTLTGASHAPEVGFALRGIPAGEKVDLDLLKRDIIRRSAASFENATPRREADGFTVVSGIAGGVTTGETIRFTFENRAYDRSEYRLVARPSHADLCAFVRSGGTEDISGGGRYSGRMTLPLVAAGGVCRQILARRGMEVFAHVAAIGELRDAPFDPMMEQKPVMDELFPLVSPSKRKWMEELISVTRAAGDTLSSEAECAVLGAPVGLGEPLFGGVEATLSKYLFAIPGLRSAEFAERRPLGSDMNDQFTEGGRTKTNNSRGINGGMANGMPIIFRAWFRPVPSISLPQTGFDLIEKKPVPLMITGRHDTAILPRGLVAVEAAACLAMLEMLFEYDKRN